MLHGFTHKRKLDEDGSIFSMDESSRAANLIQNTGRFKDANWVRRVKESRRSDKCYLPGQKDATRHGRTEVLSKGKR